MTLYNEHEQYAARWLDNLIGGGHIARGLVDSRSIRELTSRDLRNHIQAHFFAGIGVWSRALRRAGWPDTLPVWTGSCPCQPFSGAGKRKGFDDERHLWPTWFTLIRSRRPPVIFGEQVASPDGLAWLDAVLDDLEGAGYATRAIDFGAALVGAPHIRQRMYFVAVSRQGGREVLRTAWLHAQRKRRDDLARRGPPRGMVDTALESLTRNRGPREVSRAQTEASAGLGGDNGAQHAIATRELADRSGKRREGTAQRARRRDGSVERGELGGVADRSSVAVGRGFLEIRIAYRDHPSFASGATRGFWSECDWIFCRDGKWRPVEPGAFPLAHGATARVGRLRAYGNAIVEPQAVEFISAVVDCFE